MILGLQGGNAAAPFTTGPMFAASPFFDDGSWPFPTAPVPGGAWPVTPAARPIPGTVATVLSNRMSEPEVAGQALVLVVRGGMPVWVALHDGQNGSITTGPCAGQETALIAGEVILDAREQTVH